MFSRTLRRLRHLQFHKREEGVPPFASEAGRGSALRCKSATVAGIAASLMWGFCRVTSVQAPAKGRRLLPVVRWSYPPVCVARGRVVSGLAGGAALRVPS